MYKLYLKLTVISYPTLLDFVQYFIYNFHLHCIFYHLFYTITINPHFIGEMGVFLKIIKSKIFSRIKNITNICSLFSIIYFLVLFLNQSFSFSTMDVPYMELIHTLVVKRTFSRKYLDEELLPFHPR